MNAAVVEGTSQTADMSEILDDSLYRKLLRRAAGILRRESGAHLYEPTDLVHEAFLRIARSEIPVHFQSAAHVIALITIVMRRIMIDCARSSKSARHHV